VSGIDTGSVAPYAQVQAPQGIGQDAHGVPATVYNTPPARFANINQIFTVASTFADRAPFTNGYTIEAHPHTGYIPIATPTIAAPPSNGRTMV
jgi:hypothetical protein